MILALFLQGFIFISFVSFLIMKFHGVLPSISDSWYKLEGLQKQLFTLFCWSIGFLMFLHSDKSGLFFFSGAGLCFTGAAAAFKDEFTSTVHSIGAYCFIGFALLGIALVGSFIPAIVFIVVATLLNLLKVENRTWWIEVTASIVIFDGMLLYIY